MAAAASRCEDAQNKRVSPRPCRVTAKPRLCGFRTPLPREQEGVSLLKAFTPILGHPPGQRLGWGDVGETGREDRGTS